jgi:hypothetical protein
MFILKIRRLIHLRFHPFFLFLLPMMRNMLRVHSNGRTLLLEWVKDSEVFMNFESHCVNMPLHTSLPLDIRRMIAIESLLNAKLKVVLGEFMHQGCQPPN